jgi:hypothetical protein
LVAADDNVGGRNNPDHNTSHETTGPADKRRSRGNGDESRVEKTSLQVAEANSKDVGRRIARIDPKVSKELGLLTGDVLEISSEKAKVSVLNWPSYQQDYGKGLIRIDGYIRNKLESSQELSWYKRIAEQFGKPRLTAAAEAMRGFGGGVL